MIDRITYKILCAGKKCKNKFIKPFYFIFGIIWLIFSLLIIPFICLSIMGLIMLYLISRFLKIINPKT